MHSHVGLRLYHIIRLDDNPTEGRNPKFFYGISIGISLGLDRIK